MLGLKSPIVFSWQLVFAENLDRIAAEWLIDQPNNHLNYATSDSSASATECMTNRLTERFTKHQQFYCKLPNSTNDCLCLVEDSFNCRTSDRIFDQTLASLHLLSLITKRLVETLTFFLGFASIPFSSFAKNWPNHRLIVEHFNIYSSFCETFSSLVAWFA